MELNRTLIKIQTLLDQRSWSLYKLAKESGIPYSSLSSLFQNNNQPTISTLEKLCDGFHVTLSEFFADDTPFRKETYDITKEELEIIGSIRGLSRRDHRLMTDFLKLLEKE